MRRCLSAALVLATLGSLGVVGWAPVSSAQTTGSTYTAVAPVRVLDTRSGVGGYDHAVGPSETIALGLADRIPADATAVVLNVTGVEPTMGTFVTVFPHGAPHPNVSNLNLVTGEIRANLVTVALGADRAVDLYNNVGSTHLVADVAGYYRPGTGARYTPRDSERVLSTHIGAQGTATLDLSTLVPASTTAVVFNVTATGPTTSTYVTAWPFGTARPGTSTVNLAPGDTNANLATVAVGSGRRVSLYNNAGGIDVIVDLAGFYTPEYGAVFTPLTPKRVFDTRNGIGTFDNRAAPIGAGQNVAFIADDLPNEAIAAVLNLAGTQATAPTYVTAWQYDYVRPSTSNLNVTPGRTVANLGVVPVEYQVGSSRTTVYNHSGSVHVIGDLAGYFWIPPVPCTADCVYTWGANHGWQGVGTTTSDVTLPTPMYGLTGVTEIVGPYALRSDGTVWSWGRNTSGQLGAGWLGGESTIPIRVAGLTNVVQVASNESGGLALRADGTVWGWGTSYALGRLDGPLVATPERITALSGVASIAASNLTSYAVRSDGTVWSWGRNDFGMLGTGSTAIAGTPAQIAALTGVVEISTNLTNAYVLRSDGSVWSWGSNTSGQLGTNSTASQSAVPVRITSLSGVTSVYAGDSWLTGEGAAHAVLADGGVWSWGVNTLGQLGANSTASLSRVPVAVAGLTGVTELAGGRTMYALRSDGTVWAWGEALIYALGIDTTVPARRPLQVAIPARVVSLSVRRALDESGNVWTWGYNGSGELGVGHDIDTGPGPVRASIHGVSALRAGRALVPNP